MRNKNGLLCILLLTVVVIGLLCIACPHAVGPENPSEGYVGWSMVYTAREHTVGLSEDGRLWTWGKNEFGQLGDGTTKDHHSPVPIQSTAMWKEAAGGREFTVGIQKDSTIWTWGKNNNNNVEGGVLYSYSPMQGGLDKWKAVSAAESCAMGIREDGTLWAWGSNDEGQLGDGTTEDHYSPVSIGADKWLVIAVAGYFTTGIKENGTLWAWGSNVEGQLGDGTTKDRHSPVQVQTGTTWKTVVAGGGSPDSGHTVALREDGTLWTWGNNKFGQLGNGATRRDRYRPSQLGTDKWLVITAAANSTAGIKEDGTLWTWGNNTSGQLGDGTVENRHNPVQVQAGKTWKTVVMGHSGYTIAIREDGMLWAWGNNAEGQLGDGTTIDRHSPVQIKVKKK